MKFEEKFFDDSGQLHHPSRPARRLYNYDSHRGLNILEREEYHVHGHPHSLNSPAITLFHTLKKWSLPSENQYMVNGEPQGLHPLLPISVTYHPPRRGHFLIPDTLTYIPHHPLQPFSVSFWDNGEVKDVWWDDTVHHPDLPFNHRAYTDTGTLHMVECYENGVLHSVDDRPARVVFDATTGDVVSEEWFTAGVLDRTDDKPSFVMYHKRRSQLSPYSLSRAEFYSAGRQHRKAGPAELVFTVDGYVKEARFLSSGFVHRWGGPAVVERLSTGDWDARFVFYGIQYRSEEMAECYVDGARDVWERYREPVTVTLMEDAVVDSAALVPRPSLKAPDSSIEALSGTQSINDRVDDISPDSDDVSETSESDEVQWLTFSYDTLGDSDKTVESDNTPDTEQEPGDEESGAEPELSEPESITLAPINQPDVAQVLEQKDNVIAPSEPVRVSHATDAYAEHRRKMDDLIFSPKSQRRKKLRPMDLEELFPH